MNIEEINKWLEEEYGCSFTRLEELHNYFFEKYTDKSEEVKKIKKELFFMAKALEQKDQEIQKLNNIINEIEAIIYNFNITGIEARIEIQERLDKLKGR